MCVYVYIYIYYIYNVNGDSYIDSRNVMLHSNDRVGDYVDTRMIILRDSNRECPLVIKCGKLGYSRSEWRFYLDNSTYMD